MALFLPRRWRSQPQFPVDIDWNNPLTKELKAAVHPVFGDVVSRSLLQYFGTGQRGVGTRGYAVTTDDTANDGGYVTLSPSFYVTTNTHSSLVLFEASAIASYANFFSIPYANGTWLAPYNALVIYHNSGTSSLNYQWAINGVTGERVVSSVGWSSAHRCYIGTRNGTAVGFFVDGVSKYSSTTATTANVSWGSNQPLVLLNATNSSLPNAGATGKVYLAAHWNRALQTGEAIALNENPWQIFKPIQQLIFFDVVAGGTAYTLTAAAGSFTETGNAANLLKGNVVLTATGSFVETGNAANLVKASVLATAVGAFTETGNDANLTKQWALVADVATFVLTGNDATLDYSGDTHPPLVAESGSYTLTGNAAGLAHGYVLTTEVGTFTETGNDVTLKVGNALVTEVGAFVLTGIDSTLTKASVLSLEKGTFIMTGRNANLIWSGAGGSTVEFFRGVSKAPDGGVSKTIHTLVDGGGSTYVVTESSGVSEDKTNSPNYEGYIIT